MAYFSKSASAFLLGLLAVLFRSVVCIVEDPEVCRIRLLTQPNTTPWKDNPPVVKVEWGYDGLICHHHETCFGIVGAPDNPLVPQLKPVEIQEGMTLQFFSTRKADVTFSLLPVAVSEEGFLQCNSSQGTGIIATGSTEVITVPSPILKPGVHYFVGETGDQIYICQLGLRLNVTVKPQRCKYPQQTEKCNNHGQCITKNTQPNYHCQCCIGYTGEFCADLDACVDKPCQNNGQCIDIPGDSSGKKFVCRCPLGFAGETCGEKQKTICDNHPCLNNGSCHVASSLSTFKCSCIPGFTGDHCEVNINECFPNPCKHGAMCVDKVATYQCLCIPGYFGLHCEEQFNECQSSPCINGVCVDKVNGWKCECGIGYEGPMCQVKVDLCKDYKQKCPNATECKDLGNIYDCVCKPGFTGSHCEVNINECASYPCLNGGRCLDGVDKFTCTCLPQFTGQYCEHADASGIEAGNLKNVVQVHRGTNLIIAACTLGGALLIALLVLAGCYIRQYRVNNQQQFGYAKQNEELHTSNIDVRGVTAPRGPTPEAIYEATSSNYHDSQQDDPLINSLKPKRV